jgi:hypothetical protein
MRACVTCSKAFVEVVAAGTIALVLSLPRGATAQTSVLHSFIGGADGASPQTIGLIQAPKGYFYGTTNSGGAYGQGTVFS